MWRVYRLTFRLFAARAFEAKNARTSSHGRGRESEIREWNERNNPGGEVKVKVALPIRSRLRIARPLFSLSLSFSLTIRSSVIASFARKWIRKRYVCTHSISVKRRGTCLILYFIEVIVDKVKIVVVKFLSADLNSLAEDTTNIASTLNLHENIPGMFNSIIDRWLCARCHFFTLRFYVEISDCHPNFFPGFTTSRVGE